MVNPTDFRQRVTFLTSCCLTVGMADHHRADNPPWGGRFRGGANHGLPPRGGEWLSRSLFRSTADAGQRLDHVMLPRPEEFDLTDVAGGRGNLSHALDMAVRLFAPLTPADEEQAADSECDAPLKAEPDRQIVGDFDPHGMIGAGPVRFTFR